MRHALCNLAAVLIPGLAAVSAWASGTEDDGAAPPPAATHTAAPGVQWRPPPPRSRLPTTRRLLVPADPSGPVTAVPRFRLWDESSKPTRRRR